MSHMWFAVKNVWKCLSQQPLGSSDLQTSPWKLLLLHKQSRRDQNWRCPMKLHALHWNSNDNHGFFPSKICKLWIDLTPHERPGKYSQLINSAWPVTEPRLELFAALLSLATSMSDHFFIFMTWKEYPEKSNWMPNKQSHFWFVFQLWFPEIWLCLGWISCLKWCSTVTDS